MRNHRKIELGVWRFGNMLRLGNSEMWNSYIIGKMLVRAGFLPVNELQGLKAVFGVLLISRHTECNLFISSAGT